jgi:hypothetical protein
MGFASTKCVLDAARQALDLGAIAADLARERGEPSVVVTTWDRRRRAREAARE